MLLFLLGVTLVAASLAGTSAYLAAILWRDFRRAPMLRFEPVELGPIVSAPISEHGYHHDAQPLCFVHWMSEVDKLLVSIVGLDSGSVEDWMWRSDYDSGLSPLEAVREWAYENLPEMMIPPTLN